MPAIDRLVSQIQALRESAEQGLYLALAVGLALLFLRLLWLGWMEVSRSR